MRIILTEEQKSELLFELQKGEVEIELFVNTDDFRNFFIELASHFRLWSKNSGLSESERRQVSRVANALARQDKKVYDGITWSEFRSLIRDPHYYNKLRNIGKKTSDILDLACDTEVGKQLVKKYFDK